MKSMLNCLLAFSLLATGACVQDPEPVEASEAATGPAAVERLDVSIQGCRHTELFDFFYADETLTDLVGWAFYPCCGSRTLRGQETEFVVRDVGLSCRIRD